jgi:3'-phosphoadenosine 5'-phosphosulfate sulfotransferase (PAPS reductase)/FAD synthetase
MARLPVEIRPNTSSVLPMDQYDLVIVSFSGGKDSLACILHVLDQGVPKEKIELWHQAVDGKPGRDPRFFDWPCTESYCKAVAEALGVRLRFQWREGGFEREINKVNAPLAPASFELPDGTLGSTGGKGTPNTRLMFPNAVADLRTRWCSAILKIDVATAAINNDPRFKRGEQQSQKGPKNWSPLKEAKVLVVTGERRQESNNRARYAEVDEHKSTTKRRRVDQWRAIIDWREEQVWEIIERWRIRPHPAYYLGWGRVSCLPCIFGNPDQWASVKALDRTLFEKILAYERQFGRTIQQGGDVEHLAGKGKSFVPGDPAMIELALGEHYPVAAIVVPPSEEWIVPMGAYKRTGGPL